MTADKNEFNFLNLILPPEIFDILVTQTNLYAQQVQEKLDKPDSRWTDTTLDEMKAFIGIRLYMRILQLPAMEMYWSTDYVWKFVYHIISCHATVLIKYANIFTPMTLQQILNVDNWDMTVCTMSD